MDKKPKNLLNAWEGSLSKPKIKSVIGLFRRESTTSGSVAGSDPCLAVQLAIDLTTSSPHAASITPTASAMPTTSSGRPTGTVNLRVDRRRSISICAVTPIDESTESSSDPLGALLELKCSEKSSRTDSIYCRNNRRRSLFDLNG